MYILYPLTQFLLSGPKTYLGSMGNDTPYMQPYYTNASSANTASVKLKFIALSPTGLATANWFNGGQAVGIPDVLSVGYYTRDDRREVFISVELGAISSILLDFDGKKIRTLYSSSNQDSGRVRSFPTWDDIGRFAIREMYWRYGHADKNWKANRSSEQVVRYVYPRQE